MNLFLSESAVVKLGYFGLTTQSEYYSRKGFRCEALRSLSPEAFNGQYSVKNEVWSLGILMVELAERSNPFESWMSSSVD